MSWHLLGYWYNHIHFMLIVCIINLFHPFTANPSVSLYWLYISYRQQIILLSYHFENERCHMEIWISGFSWEIDNLAIIGLISTQQYMVEQLLLYRFGMFSPACHCSQFFLLFPGPRTELLFFQWAFVVVLVIDISSAKYLQ